MASIGLTIKTEQPIDRWEIHPPVDDADCMCLQRWRGGMILDTVYLHGEIRELWLFFTNCTQQIEDFWREQRDREGEPEEWDPGETCLEAD